MATATRAAEQLCQVDQDTVDALLLESEAMLGLDPSTEAPVPLGSAPVVAVPELPPVALATLAPEEELTLFEPPVAVESFDIEALVALLEVVVPSFELEADPEAEPDAEVEADAAAVSAAVVEPVPDVLATADTNCVLVAALALSSFPEAEAAEVVVGAEVVDNAIAVADDEDAEVEVGPSAQ